MILSTISVMDDSFALYSKSKEAVIAAGSKEAMEHLKDGLEDDPASMGIEWADEDSYEPGDLQIMPSEDVPDE